MAVELRMTTARQLRRGVWCECVLMGFEMHKPDSVGLQRKRGGSIIVYSHLLLGSFTGYANASITGRFLVSKSLSVTDLPPDAFEIIPLSP
jgi:hypothetical protein